MSSARAAVSTGMAIVVLLACSAAGASACLTQALSGGAEGAGPETPVHPGDPAYFSMNGVDPGATVTVAIDAPVGTDGRSTIFEKVIEQSDLTASGELRRTFTMPDLGGGSRYIQLSASIDHPDAEAGALTKRLQYAVSTAPAPAAAPTAESPAAGSAPAPA